MTDLAALDPGLPGELARSLAQLEPTLAPDRAARFIISLAEQQLPGAELRGVYVSIAAVALLAAARVGARDSERERRRQAVAASLP